MAITAKICDLILEQEKTGMYNRIGISFIPELTRAWLDHEAQAAELRKTAEMNDDAYDESEVAALKDKIIEEMMENARLRAQIGELQEKNSKLNQAVGAFARNEVAYVDVDQITELHDLRTEAAALRAQLAEAQVERDDARRQAHQRAVECETLKTHVDMLAREALDD
jgi:regulator of replication initiation timing